MPGIIVASLAISGCTSRQRPEQALLWGETEGVWAARYLRSAGVACRSDPRGIHLEKTEAHHRVLVELLGALRLRMELMANNLAHSDSTSTGTADEVDSMGNRYVRHIPYRRKHIIPNLVDGDPSSLKITEDPESFRCELNPEHPHSVKNPESVDFGRVFFPNVNPIVEMTEMIETSRSYEAVEDVLRAW